ncbi:hypothetical protein L596_026274 [Steinernema carpocapsae]|uniref:Uncharacterized protein n=1 Tax=Steinernema carpocapsae TaxID=34508 RepID=A0A4U5M0Z8_STECR|nr:hypothetical protein L596_026274 [Steinernema carpocapsae]
MINPANNGASNEEWNEECPDAKQGRISGKKQGLYVLARAGLRRAQIAQGQDLQHIQKSSLLVTFQNSHFPET